jgi:hypothetical protein
MLIRLTTNQTFECILQEQHALLSGVLAGAWAKSRLDPLLVQIIGMHDNPWRAADAKPLFNADRGLPHDFITYPMEPKIALYRRGIDALEVVHPWLAYMVSRHYTTFAGTRSVEALQTPERARRERLESMLDANQIATSDRALKWIKFFDIFSLYICLTGPNADVDAIPGWLKDPDAWSTAPDSTELKLRWKDDTALHVEGWPFEGELSKRGLSESDTLRIILYPLILDRTAQSQNEFDSIWRAAPIEPRAVILKPN